jgi:hypothetical protein
VKADIVFKYVTTWATVMLNPRFDQKGEAAYIDLFSGPGSYEDGPRSTPLLIVEEVLKKQLLRDGLKTYFRTVPHSHTSPAIWPEGIIVNTIFGPVEVAGAVGNYGKDRFFFRVGRIF